MRLRIDHIEDYEDFEDFDEIDDLVYERSRALRKLLDGHRREERSDHHDRHRGRFRGRRDHVDWDWSADDDWSSYDLNETEERGLRY